MATERLPTARKRITNAQKGSMSSVMRPKNSSAGDLDHRRYGPLPSKRAVIKSATKIRLSGTIWIAAPTGLCCERMPKGKATVQIATARRERAAAIFQRAFLEGEKCMRQMESSAPQAKPSAQFQ